ncbi:transglycosylase SLT domain-containing protein [Halomonas sp. 5021]|uniref:transglycosylase SLT domain-containing protein n=1 Tax=Halomonas sp. 5021 TaxID=3082156 RepID=UPI002FCB85C6
MPRIPRISDQRAKTQGLPSTSFSNVNPSTPRGSFGPDLSGAANQITDMALKARDRADTAQVMEADSALTEFENNALYDPEAGALNQRGKNAFDVPERVMKDFDTRATEIRSNLSDRQVQAFDKLTAQRRQQMDLALQRHVSNEINTYEQQQAESLIAGSQVTAANYYNNPERIGIELRRQRGAIMARSSDMGWSPEKVRLEINKAESATHGAVIDRMAANDPAEAIRYYAKHGPEMTPQDRVAYDKVIQTTRERDAAARIVDSLTAGQGEGADGVWTRMVQQESGGQQFGRDGQPLTSSRGAIGIAQVMPGTASEAARMAGLEWDEDRYRNDPEYNLALGRAYFDAQVEKYGDPALAAAAYNAGPGRVDAWLRENGDPRADGVSHEEWIARIPIEETRGYVRNVTRGARAETLQRSEQMAVLNSYPSGVREAATEGLEAVWKQQDQQLSELYEAVKLEVENGTRFHRLPSRALDRLNADQIKALKARSRELVTSEPTMDWDRWTEITMMDRDDLAAIEDPYTALRPHLDDSHYEKAVQLINDAKGIRGEVETSSTLSFTQRVRAAAEQAEMIPAGESPKGDGARTYSRFQTEAAGRIESAERQAGRKLTGNEQQEVIDSMLIESFRLDRFGPDPQRYLWDMSEEERESAYVPADEVPGNEAEEIRNRMLSNGVMPTPEAIAEAWQATLLGDIEQLETILKGQSS